MTKPDNSDFPFPLTYERICQIDGEPCTITNPRTGEIKRFPLFLNKEHVQPIPTQPQPFTESQTGPSAADPDDINF